MQGVFFRTTIRAWANELKLVGYVSNNPDGSVEIAVQGRQEAMDELVARCYNGTKTARVEAITRKSKEADSVYSDFKII